MIFQMRLLIFDHCALSSQLKKVTCSCPNRVSMSCASITIDLAYIRSTLDFLKLHSGRSNLMGTEINQLYFQKLTRPAA